MAIPALSFTLEITKRCANQCTFCSPNCTPEKKQPQLTLAQCTGYLRQARDLQITSAGVTGGDVFLHPNLLAIAKQVNALGFSQFDIAISTWASRNKESRVAILKGIYGAISRCLNFSFAGMDVALEIRPGHHTEVDLYLTLSPLMFQGQESTVCKAWHATLDGLAELSPLIGNKLTRCTYRDDGTAWELWAKQGQLPPLLVEVLRERGFPYDPAGRTGTGATGVQLTLPRESLFLDLDFQLFNPALGRAAELGLQPKHRITNSRCPLEILRRKTPDIFVPLVTASGHLQPCCIATLDAKPAEEIALKVDPEEPGSLLRAFEWYQQNEPLYFARAREIYQRMGQGADFCLACVEARGEMIKEGHPVA